VATVLEPLLVKCQRDQIEEVLLFMDGARKHFKNQYICRWLAHTAMKIPSLSIVVTYFESNHGAGACDSAAAQASNEIQWDDLNKGSQPHKGKTVENAIRVINTLLHHDAQEVKVVHKVDKSDETKCAVKGPKCFVPGKSFVDPDPAAPPERCWKQPGISDIYKMKYRNDGFVEMFFYSDTTVPDFIYEGFAPAERPKRTANSTRQRGGSDVNFSQ
jgi:hypothetical protein